jgi:hypothetical protein
LLSHWHQDHVVRDFFITRRQASFARPWIVISLPQADVDAGNVMILLSSVLRPYRFPYVQRLAALGVTAAFLTFATDALAQERYRTPDKAVAALVDAMRSEALQRVMRVLGPGSDEIVSSGDPVDDAATRKRFLDAFSAKHQILPDGKDQAVLVVGEEQWPFPVRLVRLNQTWRFEGQLARSEIVYRRIGRNEMSAINACDAYVTAQKEYAEKGFAGKGVYARRFISQPGERDGLYWPAPSGENESPLGEFATSAAAQGYSVEGKRWAPYQGYYYRILTRQGPNAPGGEVDYMVSGNMVGGFALVAYPAQYRSSGLMTFLVNHQGTIYEKDLGWRTTDIALGMTSFDPDRTWRRVKHAVRSPTAPQ